MERINIVSQEGKVQLVITCAERLPDPVVNGQAITRQGRYPGLIFYNADGDECGGLVFEGRRDGEGYHAGAGLLFDQYRQDQVVGLAYEDDSGRRHYGLHVWERPTTPVTEAAGRQVVHRGFVGRSADGEVMVMLKDSRGNPRIRMLVGADDQPRLEFLDADGRVTYSLPPDQGG